MKDDTLLSMAKRNLRVADLLYNNLSDDDGELNIVAYHLQQAVELALKHHLEVNGINYPRSHDIDSLLELTNEEDFPELLGWAGTITNMESKTRYVKNYRTSLRIVKNVRKLTEELITKIEKMDTVE